MADGPSRELRSSADLVMLRARVDRMENSKLGQLIIETGRLLELRDGASTESRAYERLGNEIAGLPKQLAWMPRGKWPESIVKAPETVVDNICLMLEQGALPLLLDLRASIPPGVVEVLQLPGFGTNRVRILREQLGIESVEDLEAACNEAKVRDLKEFDERSEQGMLDAITFWRSNKDRHLLHLAWSKANPMLARLRTFPGVIRCDVTGGLRRWTETVPGISFLVSAVDTAAVLEHFLGQDDVVEVTDRTETSVTAVIAGGLRSTLRVVSDRMYPFALTKYTGNGAHFAALCESAKERGFDLNEYGMTRTELDANDPKARVRCHGEEDIYNLLDMQFIPPELRENDGEFDAAENYQIPPLVEWTALRGSLHNHSNWSDGRQTLQEMAAGAYDMGCSYWAVTDHSRSCFAGKGLDEKRLIAQINEVELVNQLYQDAERPFRLLSGSEVDIKSAGKLDFADDILAQLDVVVASIHQALSGSEAEMTRRLVAAAENRHVHMIGHMSGRMLLQRDAYKVNQKAVIDACAETDTWIELNASPWRLDMDWRLWRYASERGVKCVINTNSHRAEQGQNLLFGAHLARKGWLTKFDIVNTQPLKQLRDTLLKKRLQ